MPLIWEPNEVYLEHNGVTVYCVYKDDSYDGGRRVFWFGLTPYASDEGDENGEFDVRDLHAATDVVFDERTALLGGNEELIRAIIVKAIESGELRWPQEDEEDE